MKLRSTTLQPILFAGLLVVLLTLSALTQVRFDEASKPFSFKLEAIDRHIIPYQLLKHVNFGFSSIMADYYWIMAVQDLSHWNNKDIFYLEYFKNIATLDPRFEYPFLFGIFVVPNEKSPELLDKIAEISEDVMTALPDDWAIPFYLSTKYKTLTKNLERTEHYLFIAQSKKEAPNVVHVVYNGFITNQTKERTAISQMIKVIYDTTDNETIKKLAAKGILINELNGKIEEAIAKFKIKYGEFPANYDALEKTSILTLPQEIKDAFSVEIYKDGSFRLVEKAEN